MPKIEFNGWSAVPNPLLEGLCKDKRLPLTDRVFYALLRLIIGHEYNRQNNEGSVAYSQIRKLTGAGLNQIIVACRVLEGKKRISITRGVGQWSNRYSLHL